MSNPLVSVVMCVYNTNQDYLKEAIESILDQTYKKLEFIIVDDCSTVKFDYSAFNDERIKLIRNSVNRGLGYSRAVGINASSGEYIAIMDSDDKALPKRIERQVEFLESHPDIGVCGTWYKYFGDKNHEKKIMLPEPEKYKCLLFFNNIPSILNPSVTIRKSVLIENNINVRDLRSCEDYMLWVELSQVTRFHNLEEVLMMYRWHNGQMSANKNESFIKNKKRVYAYQFNRLNMVISDNELDVFCKANLRMKYNIFVYRKLLNKIMIFNNLHSFYDNDIFLDTLNDNLYMVIRRTKNPFKLIGLMFCGRPTFKICIKTIVHRFKRIY